MVIMITLSVLLCRYKPKAYPGKMTVQVDPFSQRNSASAHQNFSQHADIVSVLKPAKRNLQLNRSFRQTVPNRFVAK